MDEQFEITVKNDSSEALMLEQYKARNIVENMSSLSLARNIAKISKTTELTLDTLLILKNFTENKMLSREDRIRLEALWILYYTSKGFETR